MAFEIKTTAHKHLSGLTTDMPAELAKLAKLIEEQCVEFITDGNRFRIIYLANDCVESYLEFIDFEINGTCLTESDEYISASVERYNDRFLIVFRQGEGNVFTVTFKDTALKVHTYNYGKTGHFWVDGNYDLRLIDYWLGIINDKYRYLEEYCSGEEIILAKLSQFRPLRYFNSVPEKYMSDSDIAESTTPESIEIFTEFVRESGDEKLIDYIKQHGVGIKNEKTIAKLLTKPHHSTIVNHIIDKIQSAAEIYPCRDYGEKSAEYLRIYQRALKEAENYKNRFCNVRVFKEEPFVHIADSMDFKAHILISENGVFKRKHKLIEFT